MKIYTKVSKKEEKRGIQSLIPHSNEYFELHSSLVKILNIIPIGRSKKTYKISKKKSKSTKKFQNREKK